MNKTRIIIISLILLLSLALVTGVLAAVNTPYNDEVEEESNNGKKADTDSPFSVTPDAIWPGPDGYGYIGMDFTYNWVDITGTGTDTGLNADDGFAGPFPIGFSFEFYGNNWTDFYVGSNGFISFGAGSTSLSNQCPLPNTSSPNDVIPLLWDDLVVNPADGGFVYYEYFPVCPIGSGECLVVEYFNVRHFGGTPGNAGTWEAILFGNNDIVVQFLDSGAEEGSSSTTGIEDSNAAADWGLTYACNAAASVTDGTAIQFILPPPAPRFTDSSKDAPALVEWGDPLHYTIDIVNTGELPAMSAVLTDVIPYGTEYISGSVTCSSGSCWFDDVANTVYWTGTVEAPIIPPLETFVEPSSPPAMNSGKPATNLLQFGESNVSGSPAIPMGSTSAMDILLDQPPNQSNGIFADASCDICGGPQVLAENFVLTSTVNIGQIVFWTGYFPTDTPIDPDQITVIFHADASGFPGADLYTETNIAYDRVQTGVILFGVHEWMHTLTLATPVTLGPGTYWVEIYNDTGFGTDDMFWEVGDVDPDSGILGQAFAFEAPGVNWNYDPSTDLAIQLIAAPEGMVTVEFDVQPLACGLTIENEAVLNDPDLPGGPVYLYASTEVVGTSIYSFDFEPDDGGFVSVGVDPWTWGPPPMGPAHSGVNAWSTESPYVANSDYQLESPWIDLTGEPPNLELSWWQDIYIESATWDHAYVEVTTDTVTYEILWQHTGGTYNSNGWELRSADISGYAGELVQFRFRMDSDSVIQYDGWAIDDVVIRLGCPPPDIQVDAPPLHAYVYPDSTSTIPFDVCNVGESLLNWSVKELSPTINRVSFPTGLINASPVLAMEPDIMRLPDGTVDCAAYENNPFTEPREVAEACYGYAEEQREQSRGNFAPTDLGFAHDIGFVSDNVVEFTLNDFPGQTVLSFNANSIYGYDYDVSATILYALNGGTNELGTFDKYTGLFTPIGASVPGAGESWTGITVDPSSDVLYATGTTCSSSTLYVLDPMTGAATAVGPMTGVACAIDIAMSPSGEMYTHDITTDSIYQVDPATGVGTLVGPTGYAANFAQGMDFDNDDGTLYIFLYQGGGANVYGTVDLATGAVTPLAVDNPLGEFEGAIEIPGFVVDIPWLSEAPTDGSVFPDSCDMVDVLYDSTGLANGDYYAGLSVESNDPDTPVISLPVTMTVASPAIELTKTVGIDPNVCATTNSIQVATNTDVTYCYEVMNTGDITLPLHTLVDSELGTILDGFAYDLAPGASVFLTQTASVVDDTTNTATWTAYVNDEFFAEASDSVTVDVVWPAIELTKTVGTDPNVCADTDSIAVPVGTDVTYCYEVSNTGEDTLPFHDLVDSELGVLLDDFAYDLNVGESVFITQTVTVMMDTVNTATWTAFLDEFIYAEASDMATVTVYTEGYVIHLPLITK